MNPNIQYYQKIKLIFTKEGRKFSWSSYLMGILWSHMLNDFKLRGSASKKRYVMTIMYIIPIVYKELTNRNTSKKSFKHQRLHYKSDPWKDSSSLQGVMTHDQKVYKPKHAQAVSYSNKLSQNIIKEHVKLLRNIMFMNKYWKITKTKHQLNPYFQKVFKTNSETSTKKHIFGISIPTQEKKKKFLVI